MQIFNSIDFLLYFFIVGFIEDKDEEGVGQRMRAKKRKKMGKGNWKRGI